MGQSSSGLQSSSAPVTPRGKTGNRPPPRPEHPPKIPKQPNFVVPENKVLPNGVGDINNAKKLLRPVSQELTKFHPEFADIFQYDPEIGFEAGDDSLNQSAGFDKENLNASAPASVLSNGIRQSNSLPRSTTTTKTDISDVGRANTTPLTNGFVPNGNSTAVGPLGNGHVKSYSTDDILSSRQSSAQRDMPASTNLKRSQSMERERPQPPRISRHRRQSSVTTTVPIQSSVIYEDPREHLYNVGRHEPFNNVQPSTTSLPLKSSFGLDYSFNVTYAQLAEYRRQKRVSELEARTGKKMEELEAELAANSTVPKSPFDRANLGAKTATHSVSTGSSDSGVSKSKKKKAPAPPPPVGVLPARDKSPGRFSLDTEPPADYDMEEVSTPRDSRPVQRRNSSASGHVKAPAPQPLAKRNTVPRLLDTNSFAPATTATTASPPPNAQVPPPAPPAPPPLPGPASTEEKFKLRPLPGQSQLQQSMADAKAQLEALKKLQEMLNSPKQQDSNENSTQIADTTQSEDATKTEKTSDDSERQVNSEENEGKTTTQGLEDEKGNEPEEIVITNLESSFSSTGSRETGKAPVKRLSSLLQHDIVLAAQARGAKIVKSKPPQSLEKPKDASEMFREELAKAATAREERRKEAANNDSKNSSRSNSVPSTPKEEGNIVFKSSLLKVVQQMGAEKAAEDKMDTEDANKDILNSTTKSEKADDKENAANATIESSILQSDEASEVDKDESSRVFHSSWTPEDDLDSDDDIMDESFVHPSRHVSTEGFKSSMVPPKVDDLKKDKKKKKKTSKKYEKRQSLDSALDERNKFESIRKLRKSVHEGMRNAIGSISKASGKLLKKPKSQEMLDITQVLPDTLDVDDDRTRVSRDRNWELSDSRSGSLRRTTSETYMTPAFINGVGDSESSSESGEDLADIDFSSGINDIPTTTKAAPAPNDENAKQMKRAGVAYVSSKGQIIVLPEYETVKVDEEGHVIDKASESESHAPKIFRKKNKKFTYESTVRQSERQRMEEAVAKEIKEKEMQIEMERMRQQEMERDFRRLRDLDTQEKLQRLQTDSLRQQITLLQQQQVRQAHSKLTAQPDLSAPTNNSSGNHNGVLIGGSDSHLVNMTSNGPTSHYSVSSFPTTVLNQPIPHATLAATTPVDPATYATHSAPLIGGPAPLVANPVTLSAGGLPNMTAHELSYLSEYMRMMGVTPPSTQQQWAVLLSTFSVNSPLGFQGFDLHQAPTLQNGYSTMAPGPDLSQIFGGGKRMDGVLGNASKKQLISIMAGQQEFQPMDVAAVDPDRRALNRLAGGDGSYPKAVQIVDPHLTGIPAQPSPLLNTQYPFQNASTTVHTSNISINNNNNSSKNTAFPKKSPPPTADKPFKDKKNEASGNRNAEMKLLTSPEERMDYLTSGNAAVDGRDNGGTGHFTGGAIVTGSKVVSTPTLSPKVYGPIGFRPVSFQGSTS